MRILSGIQPSGRPHLGNYFGMMKPAIDLQGKGQALLFIADYHALTSHPKADDLRQRVRDLALDFIACGLDLQRTLFFRQSDVMEVTELSWILSNVCPVSMLEKCHSYKDKVSKGILSNSGLFTYPILMASDILLYQSNIVPVGRDQKQHVEVTRDLAQRFNHEYGEVFVLPDPMIREDMATIVGLDGQKMSKSYNNTIELFGEEKATRKKIMSIQTDCKGMEEPKDPTTCSIFALYKLFANEAQQYEMAEKYRAGHFGYGHAKQALFDLFWETMRPMRERRESLAKDPAYVDQILAEHALKARLIARETIDRVRNAVGLR